MPSFVLLNQNTTISLLVVVVVVTAAAVAVHLVMVVVVLDVGFLALGDCVMTPVSHSTVGIACDIITGLSSELLLTKRGLHQTGRVGSFFLSYFTIKAMMCCKIREYKPLVMSLQIYFIRVHFIP